MSKRSIIERLKGSMAAVTALWSALLLAGCGNSSSVAVIGGADGPTALFIAGKIPGGRSSVFLIILVLLIVVVGLVSWWKQKKK